jgi:hypothetical protein
MLDALRDIWFGNSFARFVTAGDCARNSFLNPRSSDNALKFRRELRDSDIADQPLILNRVRRR